MLRNSLYISFENNLCLWKKKNQMLGAQHKQDNLLSKKYVNLE